MSLPLLRTLRDLPRQSITALLVAVIAFASIAPAPTVASPFETSECFSKDLGRRLQACSELLAQPGLSDATRASAFAMRALSLSLLGRFQDAINDYDKALAIDPNQPVALNNRAWAKYRSGQHASAWPDIRRSLELDAGSPHAYDTRAHLHQAEGVSKRAYDDYVRAMELGGGEMIKLYQCGLQAEGHYTGAVTGIVTDELLSGLKACTKSRKCDPLPPDEECKVAMS